MSERRPVTQCQRRLLVLWSSASVLGLVVLLVQTSPGGAYQPVASDVWDWFLPSVVPVLSLMLGTVASEALREPSEATMDAFAYRVALVASCVYLTLVLGVLLMYAQSSAPVADLKRWSKVLTALNGVVGITIGSLFVSRKAPS